MILVLSVDVNGVYFSKSFGDDDDENTTMEPLAMETTTKKMQSKSPMRQKSHARLPPSQSRDLYENVKIAVDGKPIPDDFVALSPLHCTA